MGGEGLYPTEEIKKRNQTTGQDLPLLLEGVFFSDRVAENQKPRGKEVNKMRTSKDRKGRHLRAVFQKEERNLSPSNRKGRGSISREKRGERRNHAVPGESSYSSCPIRKRTFSLDSSRKKTREHHQKKQE